MSTDILARASGVYRYLIEEGFPHKASLKLVGDRFMLSTVERNALFRGVVDGAIAEARRRKILAPAGVARRSLGVDLYNVLITVESYLKGLPLFLADDGITRDAAATHGSYRRGPVTDRALSEILGIIVRLRPMRVDIYLDSPIAFSGQLAEEIRSRAAAFDFPLEVFLERSADFRLKSYPDIVASSDSVILDHAASILDLARCILEACFSFTPPRLLDFDPAAPSGPGRSSEPGNPGSLAS